MDDLNQGNMTMYRSNNSRMTGPKLGLIMTTALASVALSGCTTGSAPRAETSVNKAQVALEKGQADKAISYAESAVLAEPRNASHRAMLGAAYLEAGRFQSAATSFEDALQLGDTDPRTVLSYALAKTAVGDSRAAVALLSQNENVIAPADLGLAYALAGKPERGVHVLVNAVRNGDNSAKARQNLAYSYALAGNWRAARVMAAEDVPADQLDERLTQWAADAAPEDYQVRVAGLLNVTPTYDGGQPTYLALANFPSQGMMVAQADAQAPAEVAQVAAAPAPKPAPTLARATPAPAPAVAAPSRPATPRYVSNPVVQQIPASRQAQTRSAPAPTRVASTTSQRRMAVASGDAATHLVQLGSFNSRAVAEDKWAELKRKFPQLRDRDVVITEAKVNGQTFFRVAATGFTQTTARQMCGTARSAGTGCFAYAASNPPAGAVDRGVRIAAR
jgi:Flp pilus assembly protein TadD